MLLNREPLKSTFKFFTFFGLWDEIPVRQKRWTLKAPTFLFIFCASLITLSILQGDGLENTLDVVKIVPVVVNFIYLLFSFLLKKQEVRKLIQLVEEIEAENDEFSAYMDEALKMIKRIAFTIATLAAVMFLPFVFIPLFIGKLSFPMFTPNILKDEALTFYAYWLLQCFAGFYCIIIYNPLHEFRCSLLVILDSIMQCFRAKLRSIDGSSKNMLNDLKGCIKLHLQIRQ
jgi:hypothetical protein